MSLKIAWCGNVQLQPTGYARVAREIMPRLVEAGHDVIQYAVSGLNNTMPAELNGIRTYGPSSMGGNLGVYDYPVVDHLEDIDFWIINFDAWATGDALEQMDIRYVLYPPIDHDPIAANWMSPIQGAHEIVPYTHFGKNVVTEALGDIDTLREPIYHGVDTETFHPTGASKQEFFGASDDTFVIGLFKNNQGTRWAPEKQLRAIRLFIEENDLWDDVLIYLHSSIQGEGAFDLSVIVNRLELGDNVQMVNQGTYRWGVGDDELANAYSACDVVLNCTRGEGFGLPIFEAFATETPVIAGAYSSMPELVNDDEGEVKWEDIDTDVIEAARGWLVPVWEEEATLGKHSWRRRYRAEHIAKALTAAWDQPDVREERGVHAREWVEQYTWDAVGQQWVEYLEGLEERTFTEDEEYGIDWAKVGDAGDEKGGVGGFQ